MFWSSDGGNWSKKMCILATQDIDKAAYESDKEFRGPVRVLRGNVSIFRVFLVILGL